jgi:hypothetical protein
MEIKVNEVQPLMVDPRLMPELTSKKSRVIKPVSKGTGSLSKRLGDDKGLRKGKGEDFDVRESDDGSPAGAVDASLEDVGSELCPEAVEGGQGDARVPELLQGQGSRQRPPADLVKGRGHWKELRGLIFDAKV